MNENIKKIFKIIKKIVLGLMGLLILSFILVAIYSYTFEKDKIAIDRYNFEQRDKVKSIIDKDKYYNTAFRDIKQFNSIYNSDIKPIKNCYYLSKYNGDEKFIFGFKFESMIYKFIYLGENYAYPNYDLPSGGINCVMYHCEYNTVWKGFVSKISKPCRD